MVYDATSSSSGARTLMETQKVLRYNFDAIDFRFFNKVGMNSRPNAVAMYTGKLRVLLCSISHVEKSLNYFSKSGISNFIYAFLRNPNRPDL